MTRCCRNCKNAELWIWHPYFAGTCILKDNHPLELGSSCDQWQPVSLGYRVKRYFLRFVLAEIPAEAAGQERTA